MLNLVDFYPCLIPVDDAYLLEWININKEMFIPDEHYYVRSKTVLIKLDLERNIITRWYDFHKSCFTPVFNECCVTDWYSSERVRRSLGVIIGSCSYYRSLTLPVIESSMVA